MVWIEALVAVHHRNEVVGVRQVYDIVCVAGEHVNGLNVITAHLEFQDFVSTELALLD